MGVSNRFDGAAASVRGAERAQVAPVAAFLRLERGKNPVRGTDSTHFQCLIDCLENDP